MAQQSCFNEEKYFAPSIMEPPAVSVATDEQRLFLSPLTKTSPINSSQIEGSNNETKPKTRFSGEMFSVLSCLHSEKVPSTEIISNSVEKAPLGPDRLDPYTKTLTGMYRPSRVNAPTANDMNARKVSRFESSFQVPAESAMTSLNGGHYYRNSDPLVNNSSELSTIWKRGRKQKYAHLSAEERKAIRAAQNREATRRSRERSRVRYEMMVEELDRLRKENAELWRTREVIIDLLKQHNINVPKSVTEVMSGSSTFRVTKEFEEQVSPCSEHYRDSCLVEASYPFSDLLSRDVPTRSTVLQPHM